MPNIHAILKRNYPQGMAGASGNGNPVRPHGSAAAQVLRRNLFSVRMSYTGALTLTFRARLARYSLTTGDPPALQYVGWASHSFNLTLVDGDLDDVLAGEWSDLQYGAEALPYLFFDNRSTGAILYEDFHSESLGWVIDERGDNAEIMAYYRGYIIPEDFGLYTPWLANPVAAHYPPSIQSAALAYGPGYWVGAVFGRVTASVGFGSSTGYLPEGFKCYGHSAPEQDIDDCGGGSDLHGAWLFSARQHRIHSRLAPAFSEFVSIRSEDDGEVPGGGAVLSSAARPIFSGITPVIAAF